jgi:hypothetical protein
MAKTPFWADSPRIWDTIVIAGHKLPGKATPTGELGAKVDMQAVPGKDGASMSHLGYDPAQVDVTLTFWEEAHLREFEALVPILRPRKGAPAKPVSVEHPALALYGIRALHVMKLGLLEPGQQSGTYEVKIQFAEYYPEATRNQVTKGTTTHKGAAESSGKSKGSTNTSAPTAKAPSRPSQQPVPAKR